VRCGVRTIAHGASGRQRFLDAMHGLSREAVVDTALAALRDRGG